MTTNEVSQHSISTGDGLRTAFDACVSIGQLNTTVQDATRPALVELAKGLGAYDGHSRDGRTELEAVVVGAYMTTRDNLRYEPPADDLSEPEDLVELVVTQIEDHVARSRAAHEADRIRNAQEAPNPMSIATPTEAEHEAGRDPAANRKNAKRTFVAADYPDGYTCVGACGQHKPVKSFFPAVKGGAERTQECTKCMDARRAAANPDSGIAQGLAEAERRRTERAARRTTTESAGS
jgi:hypothetical protein